MATPTSKPPAKPGFKYRPQFAVIVICTDERDQTRAYNQLRQGKRPVKVVTV